MPRSIYLKLCKYLSFNWAPNFKIKELNEHYKEQYKNLYKISENEVNKASFTVFILSIFVIFSLSFLFLRIQILIILLSSILLSLFLAIQFNLYLYRKVKIAEDKLNSLLYFIKIDFSLIQKIGKIQTDNSLNFIKLIIDYNIFISKNFKNILSKIHFGASPEKELTNCLYPSRDFKNYIKNLLMNNFQCDEYSDAHYSYSLEKDFKVYLKQLTTKLSIVFFIGIFFPIGFCFLLFLLSLNKFMMISFIPILILFLNYLFKKFISVNHYLIGFIQDDSKYEKKKLEEFLYLIKKFSLYLKHNISPERALIRAFEEEKRDIPLLTRIFERDITLFLNGVYDFHQIINSLKKKLNSFRYHTIINSILNMINEDSFQSSYKIIEIINILNYHRKLEDKLNIIMKGEKFKIFLFLLILPIITGSIGALLPFLPEISMSLISLGELGDTLLLFDSINPIDLLFIIMILLTSNLISSYYFLKIVYSRSKIFFMLISGLIFLFTFMLSLINIINFIA
ncbi:MAG: hypothetical protein JXA99_15005 [Candidatus Lokiarchaeota archaeon]|nr:hypothetical protein [Candidatus Lokiarchaeota archaeon]